MKFRENHTKIVGILLEFTETEKNKIKEFSEREYIFLRFAVRKKGKITIVLNKIME